VSAALGDRPTVGASSTVRAAARSVRALPIAEFQTETSESLRALRQVLVPGTDETLRVNGTAALSDDPDLLGRLSARGAPAQLAIRVTVRECFFHCAKAFIRSQLWRPETWPDRQKISFGKILTRRLVEERNLPGKSIGGRAGLQEQPLG
jgi:hypothetical protein